MKISNVEISNNDVKRRVTIPHSLHSAANLKKGDRIIF